MICLNTLLVRVFAGCVVCTSVGGVVVCGCSGVFVFSSVFVVWLNGVYPGPVVGWGVFLDDLLEYVVGVVDRFCLLLLLHDGI